MDIGEVDPAEVVDPEAVEPAEVDAEEVVSAVATPARPMAINRLNDLIVQD